MPRTRRAAPAEEPVTPDDDSPVAPLVLPILPRRNAVAFPHVVTPLMAMRPRSQRAIEEATLGDSRLVIILQKDPEAADIGFEDLHSVGTVVNAGRSLRLPAGATQLWVEGAYRVKLLEITQTEPYLIGKFEPIEVEPAEGPDIEALLRETLNDFAECVRLSRTLPEDAYIAAMNAATPDETADIISASLDVPPATKQSLLEIRDVRSHLAQVHALLTKELQVLELQNKIQSEVQNSVDKSQREYFLREQMRVIQTELGESDPATREVGEYREKIEAARMPEAVKTKALSEVDRLSVMPQGAPESGMVRSYIDWLVALPWANPTTDNLDLRRAARLLDRNHFGLPKVKQRILEYIAVRKLTRNQMKSPVLCFVGAPGVGKTSLGRSISEALGRKFVRVSLGGIRDEAEIRGHRRTYIGALPGRILQTMRTAGSSNPVFMLDEIDKVGADFRGDPSSALLEVLDPEQNHSFSDHYLDAPYDLSKVLFICTANILDPIIPALRDRMEVIEIPGYIEAEKLEIARKFLVPKQLKGNGLKPEQVRFTDGALRGIIRDYTHEAGVRNLEREIGAVCRKIAHRVATGLRVTGAVKEQSLERFLGPAKVFWGTAEEKDEIGVAMGVARTEMGGDVLAIEVTLMDGKGNLTLTGQLGDVMRESAQAALSYARSRAGTFNIPSNLFEKTDIHVHVPSGAIPKDGPSAGITIASAVISALTRRPVRRDVAMTGEITLRGRVLPIGGLKEKVLAADRAGITCFVLPKKNQKDLLDLPADVRRRMRFVTVDHMDEVLGEALIPPATTALLAV